MGSGQLDQRVTFQSETKTDDGGGGETSVWANISTDPTVWASVTTTGGGEGFSEERTNATSMAEFVIRNRGDLSEAMRILWDGEAYNIRHIDRMGSREMYLTINAERGVSN